MLPCKDRKIQTFHLGSYIKQKAMVCSTCYFLQSKHRSLQETSLEMRGKIENAFTSKGEKLLLI